MAGPEAARLKWRANEPGKSALLATGLAQPAGPKHETGTFGAGGWEGGGRYKFPRPTEEECVQMRAEFHRLILNRYKHLVRAWLDMDTNRDGRLSFYEFCRACQKLGVGTSARRLWEALDVDKSNFVSLNEVDRDLAALLASLAIKIWSAVGSLDEAWSKCFNRRGAIRITAEEFLNGCNLIGFEGDSFAAFNALASDMATTGICRQEFDFLQLWFAPGKAQKVSVLHPHAELAQTARLDTPPVLSSPKKRDKGDIAKEKFRSLLLNTYGNFVRAWREGLDRDHNGVLDYKEFFTACKDVGYGGLPRELWEALDIDQSGAVSLWEIDAPTARHLAELSLAAEKGFGSWEQAWHALFDTKGDDRVKLTAFVSGCAELGYSGDAEELFFLLDIDRAKYLTLETTQWISSTEEPNEVFLAEDIGSVQVTGRFKQLTRSQMRRLDNTKREFRLQKHRFAARARGEIPGSHPLAGTHLALPGSLRNSMSQSARLDSAQSTNTMRSETSMAFPSVARSNSMPNLFSKSFVSVSQENLSASIGSKRELLASAGSAQPRGGLFSRGSSSAADLFGTRPHSPPKLPPALPEVSDWVLISEGSMSKPVASRRPSLARPVSPQSPGKGGWIGRPLKLVDQRWGGNRDIGEQLSKLTRKAVSKHNLERWKAAALEAAIQGGF